MNNRGFYTTILFGLLAFAGSTYRDKDKTRRLSTKKELSVQASRILAISLLATSPVLLTEISHATPLVAEQSEAIQGNKNSADINELIEQAEKLRTERKFNAAAATWQQILVIAEKTFNPDNSAISTILERLADMKSAQGEYAKAEPLYRRSLAIRKKAHGTDHLHFAVSLNNLAINLSDQGKYSAAEPLIRQALAIREKALGPNHPDVAISLSNLAAILGDQGQYLEVEVLFQRALSIREKALGRDHPDVALTLNNLAHHLSNQGKYVGAEKLYRQSLAIREKINGHHDAEIASSLNNLASVLSGQGKYAEAEILYRRSISIEEKSLGPNHPDVALVLENLGFNLLEQGKYIEAESLLQRALAINEKTLGANHPGLALSLNNFASYLSDQGKHVEAETLYRRALSINEMALGPNHPGLATVLNNLSSVMRKQGQYPAAEALQQRALLIKEKAHGHEHPEIATILNNLAHIYQEQGKYSAAEPLIRQALAIREKALGPKHPDVALSQNALAVLLIDQGQHDAGFQLLQRSLAIQEETLGAYHPKIAAILRNLGSLFINQGQYGAAETYLRRSLIISEKAHGPNHLDVANSHHQLGVLLANQGNYSAAEHHLRSSLAINIKNLGAAHPYISLSLSSLADLKSTQGKDTEAESLYRQALAKYEKDYGPDYPALANTLNNLAKLLRDSGKYAEAELLLSRSLGIREKNNKLDEIGLGRAQLNLAVLLRDQGKLEQAEIAFRKSLPLFEKSLGSNHPDVALGYSNLADVLDDTGQYAEAISAWNRASSIELNWLIKELPLLPDQSRSAQLRKFGASWSLPFGLIDRYPSAAELALEIRLNRHGLLPEIEKQQNNLLVNTSSEVRGKVKQLQAVTQQLASVSMPSSQRAVVREQRDRLQSAIYRQIPDFRIEVVSATTVAKALPADGVLVEFQRYRPIDGRKSPNSRVGQALYIALVLKPNGKADYIQLGAADSLDPIIHKALVAMAENYEDVNNTLLQLSNRILKPLLPHLKDSRQWFLSPDGELNRVPFAALPSPQQPTTPLGQAVQVRLLTTGRELLRLKQPAATGGKNVVMANPSYDRLSAALTAPADTSFNKGPRRSAEVSSKKWKSLSGSEREGLQVAQLLNTQMISGPAATTTSLKRQQGPRVLHIATHGFFVADQDTPPNELLKVLQEENSQLDGLRQEDPQLRSGLVLAGANQPTIDPNDDGYLTAAEAVTLNLKGTELVVLSACSTGQGEVRTGEGVYGLQRSLTVAGARSTLLSLWKVDDPATAAFMTSFYKRLKTGVSRSDALAAVQKEFREGPIPAWRDPYYWAAWQLVGDWGPINGL